MKTLAHRFAFGCIQPWMGDLAVASGGLIMEPLAEAKQEPVLGE